MDKLCYLTTILMLSILPSCFAQKSGVSAASSGNLGNKVVQDGEATELGIDSGDLAGTSIEFGAGTLAIGTTVSVDEADVPAAFMNHNGVSQASPALSVTATDADGNLLNSLDQAMTLKIPLSTEKTLALIDVEKTEENLCVFLDGDDDKFYVWRRSAFTVTANIVIFQSNRFGVYQLYYCGDETIDESKDAATEGIAGSFNSSGPNTNVNTNTTDTTPPGKPSSLDDKDRHDDSTTSPMIVWATVSDADLSHYEVALGSTPGADDIKAWTNVGKVNTKQFTGLSLTNGTRIYASVRAVDNDGNVGTKKNGDGWEQLECPAHYVKVEGNTTSGLGGAVYSAGTKTIYDWTGATILKNRDISDFCIMKYEARNNTAVVSADPTYPLFTVVTRTVAETHCSSIGSDNYLIQNNFWQAVAREVAEIDDNWTEGSVSDNTSTNFLFSGHSINDPASLACDSVLQNRLSSSCTGSGGALSTSRDLLLNSGETIWDLSGNVEEWVRDEYNLSSQMPAHNTTIKSLASTAALEFGAATSHTGKLNEAGLGKINNPDPATYFFMTRGGKFNSFSYGGIFAVTSDSLDNSLSSRGFRCIYAP